MPGRRSWSRRYTRQPDPAHDVPLAWIFKMGKEKVGRTPPKQHGTYRQVVIGQATWFVHCSFAGALEFVFKALGEDSVTIDEESGQGELTVPEEMVGSWIGKLGCVAGFLRAMFGLKQFRVIGKADWKKE